MAMNVSKLIRGILVTKETIVAACHRTFTTGKAKKGSKGGGLELANAPKASLPTKEVKSTTVVGANILKDGVDPKIRPDSEYPNWLLHLLNNKRPALSELRTKNIEILDYEDLKHSVKVDSRARIKENNSVKAKN